MKNLVKVDVKVDIDSQNAGEKRRFQRFKHAEAVRFEFTDLVQVGGCLSCDLSEGGIRVRLNDFVPLNTELNLQIHLDGQNTVDCIGRVAWGEKGRFGDDYLAGLKFEESGAIMNSRSKIHGFLSQP